MTASEVIAEIDRLPPDEQQTVFVHVRMLAEEFTADSSVRGLPEAEREKDPGKTLMAGRWIAERQSRRPRLPRAIDTFIADRRQDCA